ncbi:EcsC family protein [Aridibaculum aurantiacum]|uniref:EcsC family protein n=1 Tax=Aridibaculum aurantiacum TaxID=2810307 RepID=UPI001A95F7CF|nr:EcsC family protein [Aridibaculum aurantiacum]
MTSYEYQALDELKKWQQEMLKGPSFTNKLAKRVQDKINGYIPEKVHNAITAAIKQLFKGVLFGAELLNQRTRHEGTLEQREGAVQAKIDFYRKTAAAEGGITGAGGILLGLVDFPVLMGLKVKLLFELAAVYGYEVKDYKERLYILHIFQLAFCSQETRKQVYLQMENWDEKAALLPDDINELDWRKFQQEYRDYLDLAKMAQLIPVIGAPIGAVVNYRLIIKLGKTAMNAYRMRLLPKRLNTNT